MACVTSPFDFDSIKAESEANDFRPAQADADGDDGVDFDKVREIEAQMKNALAEVGASTDATVKHDGWKEGMAESHLKDIQQDAAKAEELLKQVEDGLNDEEGEMEKERESWMSLATTPRADISLSDALVGGKGLFDKPLDGEEGEEENLETGKIEVQEAESVWNKHYKTKDENEDSGNDKNEADDNEDNTVEFFDWAKERRLSKLKKQKLRRQKSASDVVGAVKSLDAVEEEGGKKKKRTPRRTKSTKV